MVAFVMSACSKSSDNEHERKPEQVISEKSEKIYPTESPVADKAILRNKVPENALAYFRIPNPWGFFAAPKGNPMALALAHPANIDAVKQLQQSLHELTKNYLNDPQAEVMASLLLYHLISPVEIMLTIPDAKSRAPLPNILITAKMNFKLIDEVNAWIEKSTSVNRNVRLIKSLGQDGYGLMALGPLAFQVYFNMTDQQLWFMYEPGANDTALKNKLASLKLVDTLTHPMFKLEQQIDQSQRGLFNWLNIGKAMPMLDTMLKPQLKTQLKALGLYEVQSIASGWGVSEQKGRLKVIVERPNKGLRQFSPVISNKMGLKTAGMPNALASISMPDKRQLQQIEKKITQQLGESSLLKYHRALNKIDKSIGFSVYDMLDAIGPELLVYSDQAGEYFAVALRNREKFQMAINKLVQKFQLQYEQKTIKGKLYHHLKTHSPEDEMKEGATLQKNEPMKLLERFNTNHFYWIEDQGYLIFSGVPQALFDRNQYSQRVLVKQWLDEDQKQNGQSSWLLISMNVANVPRYFYYGYLQLLSFLGDISSSPVDLFQLPGALALDLPQSGGYGVQLDLSDQYVTLEFIFENNPLEIVVAGQGVTSLAVIGVLAAVASPAYEDYILRAKVASGFIEIRRIQRLIEIHWLEKNVFPDAERIDEWLTQQMPDKNLTAQVIPDVGTIVITFMTPKALSGKKIKIQPEVDNQKLVWQCSTDLPKKMIGQRQCIAF